jgi:nicotinamide-nucleotide amidase
VKAEIVSIGSELLLGETTDTNASYLASQLVLLGIDLHWVSQVGDDLSRLVEVIKRAWQRSDLVLTSGGLGPTADDLTREAIAEMLGEKLAIDASLERELRQRFDHWGMNMPQSNLRQATLIPSARSLKNAQGTAPGWWVERDGRSLIALPGPPREMQEMWQKEVQPRLQQGSKFVILARSFKTLGLSEAAVGEMAFPLFPSENPILGVYAKPDGIQLRLKARAESQKQAEAMLAEGEAKIRKVLGDYIWGTDNDTLETAIGRLLVERGLTLAIMEDYSGGWLTASLTDVPESTRFFRGGLIVSTDQAKIAFGVKAETISKHGAVSAEVAKSMAEAVKSLLKANIGIGITGIDEASGPTGTVFVSITDGQGGQVVSRPRGKRRITSTALFELRKLLLSPG